MEGKKMITKLVVILTSIGKGLAVFFDFFFRPLSPPLVRGHEPNSLFLLFTEDSCPELWTTLNWQNIGGSEGDGRIRFTSQSLNMRGQKGVVRRRETIW